VNGYNVKCPIGDLVPEVILDFTFGTGSCPTHYFGVLFALVNPDVFLKVVLGLIELTLDVLVAGTNASIDRCSGHDLLGKQS
jgi:hypothetical protein